MQVDKVTIALEKGELRDMLLGNKDYAVVYPHFFDLLRTDVYSVLLSINELYLKNEPESKRMVKSLQLAFESFINDSEDFFYLLRYLLLYLEKKAELGFKLDLLHVRNAIIANKYLWLSLNNIEWNGYNLLELCKNCIYGFTAYDGTKMLGINDYFERIDVPLIPHFEVE